MKELEIEYKKAIELEMPDLWSRIESGIDEYEATVNTEKAEAQDEKIITGTVTEIDEKKRDTRKIVAYTGRFVAAAACLLLAIGVVNIMRGADKATTAESATEAIAYSNDSASTDSSAYEASDEANDSFSQEMTAAPEDEYIEYEAAEAEEAASESEEYAKNDMQGVAAPGVTGEENRDYSLEADIDNYNNRHLAEIIGCSYEEALRISLKLGSLDILGASAYTIIEDDNVYEVKKQLYAENPDEVIAIGFTDDGVGQYTMYVKKSQNKEAQLLAVYAVGNPDEKIYDSTDENR